MTVSGRGRAFLVAGLLLAALAIRVAHVEGTPYRAVNDAGTFTRLSSQVSRTGDYDTGSGPGTGAGGSHGPTAYFPPAFQYFLAGIDILDGHRAGGRPSVPGLRLSQPFLGTIAVGLIGLVAVEAFGPGVGLIALALAAVYPALIADSGTLVAENLLLVLELAAIWCALRARRARARQARAHAREPGFAPGWVAATGALTGLAILTHEDAVFMLIPLGFAVWPGRAAGPRAGAGALAILLATAALVVSPWTIRNAVELHRFIPVSDETGITLVGAFNPDSAAFARLPYKWRFYYKISEDQKLRREARNLTEPQLGDRLLDQAVDYIAAHPGAPLAAGFHNTLRMLELAGPFAYQASATAVDLDITTARIAVVGFWVAGLLALAGVLSPYARRAPRWLWGVPLAFFLSVVFINVETPRFREPIDPFVVMLAACALAWWGERARARRSGRAPVRRRGQTALSARDRQLVEVVKRLT